MNRIEATPPAPAPVSQPERRLAGIPVAAGIGIGPVFGTAEARPEVPRRTLPAAEAEAEAVRLDAAVAQSRKQLAKLRARLAALPDDSQAEIAPLLDAYMQMLGPSRLLRHVRRRIAAELVNAEAAVADEAEAIAAAILALPDDAGSAQRRADEVREIARRILRNLTGTPFRSFAGLPYGAVLVAESLRPADAALLDPARLAGVATEEGGLDGHTAVMLRALGVPAVLGAPGLLAAARPGSLAVVDGATGLVTLNPSDAALDAARQGAAAFARERQKLGRLRRLPAQTADGEAVELQANLELPVELPLIAQAGAAGIGLLRSEFLFMNRPAPPDEDAQEAVYRAAIGAMAGDPVTVRVLDWGGEKDIESLPREALAPAANPALGLRGIRMLLRAPELLDTQLAAILRAAVAGPTRILLPMVTNVSEVRAAREALDRVARRLRRRGAKLPDRLPPLGIMIETPGAALAADALALEADFFAIGTNDLAMYTLAVDRAEAEVAALYDPLHPAVLRLVQFSVEAALRLRMPVSVCGEVAGDPRMIPLLLGFGLRSFSMNAAALPRVKQAVRAARIDDCARFARRVMDQTDPARVHALMQAGPGGA